MLSSSSFTSRFIALGAMNAFIAVGAGAFAAHGLQHSLNEKYLAVFHTAADYQLVHALGLLLLGLLYKIEPIRAVKVSAYLMLTGIIIFSGSLYILVLTNMKWLGMVTPIGGLCFLLAWLYLAIAYLKKS